MPTATCSYPGCTWELWLGDERSLARACLSHRMRSHPLEPTTAEYVHHNIDAVVQREVYGKRDDFGIKELPIVRGVNDAGQKVDTGPERDPEREAWERARG
jgi:hypothetical protein